MDPKPAMADAPLLAVENLTLAIRGASVVDRVSFAVGRGEVVAIVGESGCGKSLTALAVMRLLAPAVRLSGGRILFEGRDLAALPEAAMCSVRGRDLAMIFQEPTASLDPLMMVGSQLGEALRIHQAVSTAAGAAVLAATWACAKRTVPMAAMFMRLLFRFSTPASRPRAPGRCSRA